jgi:hypothetical protein
MVTSIFLGAIIAFPVGALGGHLLHCDSLEPRLGRSRRLGGYCRDTVVAAVLLRGIAAGGAWIEQRRLAGPSSFHRCVPSS